SEMQKNWKRRLNEIWIGSYKIRVLIARDKARVDKLELAFESGYQSQGAPNYSPGTTYAKVVKKGLRMKKPSVSQSWENKERLVKGLQVSSDTTKIEWLKDCLVGKCYSIEQVVFL
ncbi:hypothetical protein Ancab_014165, partial [Ancistrocladus abbreviatus]